MEAYNLTMAFDTVAEIWKASLDHYHKAKATYEQCVTDLEASRTRINRARLRIGKLPNDPGSDFVEPVSEIPGRGQATLGPSIARCQNP